MEKQITVGAVLKMKTAEELKALNAVLALGAAVQNDRHHFLQFSENAAFLSKLRKGDEVNVSQD
jgi:hypothetical protein